MKNKNQKTLFNSEEFNNNYKEWEGMPEYISENKKPIQQIIVSFETHKDLVEFSKLLNCKFTKNTKSCWFPIRKKDSGDFYKNKNWKNEK